jgi:hypothetical protein
MLGKEHVLLMRINEIYSSQIPETRRSFSLMNALLALSSCYVRGVCMHDIKYRAACDLSTDHGDLFNLSLPLRWVRIRAIIEQSDVKKLKLISANCLSLSIRRCLYTSTRRPGGRFLRP